MSCNQRCADQEKNIREVKRILEGASCRSLRGHRRRFGRTVIFDNCTGQLSIRNLKSPAEVCQ
jgi:hypothetical protein